MKKDPTRKYYVTYLKTSFSRTINGCISLLNVILMKFYNSKEKPGSDNKALQIISTTGESVEPDVYEVAIVQPRDRYDWINGIRRAVDLSGGGSLAESSLEIEIEKVCFSIYSFSYYVYCIGIWIKIKECNFCWCIF